MQAGRHRHMLADSQRRGPDPGGTSPKLLPLLPRCPSLRMLPVYDNLLLPPLHLQALPHRSPMVPSLTSNQRSLKRGPCPHLRRLSTQTMHLWTQHGRDWQSRTSQASSTRTTSEPAQKLKDTHTVRPALENKDSDPKVKIKRKKAAGSKSSRASKLSRRAGPARPLTNTANSSKQAASSTEVMDPDYRPDPAKRPRIVSPWLEPMSKAAERYMRPCFLYPMQPRCSLRHLWPPPRQNCPHCEPVKQKLTAALLFPYTLCANLRQVVSAPHHARPTSAFNPPNHMHHCPSTRCTAVPGPKSGSNPIAGHIPKASSYLLLFCMPILRGASVRITEPRVGGAVDRHPPEAIRWQPLHATNTAKPFGLSLNEAPHLKAIRKRSLFRALRRLDRTGRTTYRGHRFTLPLADISPRTPPRSIRPQLDGRARPRLHVMSWNAGGLSSDRYQQLLLWLQGPGKHLHVVAVQETHWRHDASYKVPGWHAYHFPCSATDKSAGILILVNQLLYPPHKVQLTCLVKGRLIHLRLELSPSAYSLSTPLCRQCSAQRPGGSESRPGTTLEGVDQSSSQPLWFPLSQLSPTTRRLQHRSLS